MEVWGMSNQVMKVDIFVFQRYPKRFFVLLSQNLGSAKKSDGATLTQIWQFCQNWTKWSWWWRSPPAPLLESKFFQTPHVVVSTLTFSIWIYLPFDVCSLHIVDIVMFGSARWPSSHYWGLLLHCVEVFYTRGSSSFFPSIIFFFARRERFAGSSSHHHYS